MTTLTADTTAELADNDLVAVPKAEWTAMQERVETLETEVEVHASNTKGAHSRISKLSERVDDVEADVDASNPGGTVTEEGAREDREEPETWTPLDEIVSLPEELAARELTANQERARFIARDARDYAEKCPAGLVIDSRAIKRVDHRQGRNAPAYTDSRPCHGVPR